MSPTILTLIQLAVVLLLAPMTVGLTRFLKARFQGRHGAVPWLPYFTYASLLKKENIIPSTSSWMFRFVPYVVLGTGVLLAMTLPLLILGGLWAGLSNFLVVCGILSLNSTFMILGGLDTGNTFSGLGASRAMTVTALLEPSRLLIFTALAVATGVATLDGMLTGVGSMGGLLVAAPYLLLSILALVIVVLAENARYPIDNPVTQLELTMVNEAMLFEYSGPYLAMLEYASALKLTIFALLLTNFISPWPLLTHVSRPLDILIVLVATCLKLGLSCLLLALLESTITKMRFYRLQELLTGALFMALSGLALALLSRLL